jgi:RNA recognition motif-containing protein
MKPFTGETSMAVRLFVGNLPYNATEAELRDLFSAVGPVSYIYLPTDRETGKPRGFAFVEFNDRGQAEEAIRRFNSQLFKGRPLAINEARAKEDRPPSSGPRPQSSGSSRPFAPRPQFSVEPDMMEPPARGGAGRNFGPDAAPRRSRKPASRSAKGERVPKGPMRERGGGRVFGVDEGEEDHFEDDLEGENFASRLTDSEDEEND